MEKDKIIKKVNMYCPVCGKTHDVEERIRKASFPIKGEMVHYDELYLFCEFGGEECEFEPGAMMDRNLLNARNEYRVTHGLLTSDKIVEIRQLYGLSQVDLARLMGWGEATISRYESKAIQDESYDAMLRLVRDNPLKALEFLENNKDRFDVVKYSNIKAKMKEQLVVYGKEYLSRQPLKSAYIDYMEPSIWNGNTTLNIPKIEAIISYFADKVLNPLKTKMMKLLWYADAAAYKERGTSITGLVYVHESYGALPIGHNMLTNLENLHVREESSRNYASFFHFYPVKNMDYSILDEDEISILNDVANRFCKDQAKDIVTYMHEEPAYSLTKPGELISFELAKDIRPFY